jgi:diguanylate cyclase (GGDEF)-like protein
VPRGCSDAAGTPLSAIVFDLDRFKSINDNHGHQTGDRMLMAFADVVRSVLRPSDLFGRHGGEEFAVVLPGAGIETAYVIAERIRHAFGGLVLDSGEREVTTTVSAGVTVAREGQSIQAILDVADGAMYRAKSRGRNRVERAGDDGPGHDTVVRVA